MGNDDDYMQLLQEIQNNLRLSEKNEESISTHEKTELRNEDFELVTGYRSGSMLLWVSSENCFYKQNTFSKIHDGMAYTCYNNECKARKVLKNNGTELITIATTHELHLPMQKMYKELQYLNSMKDLCRTEPHSVSVSQIYERTQAK